ncbi:maleylpyruvate isomerase N-terminal domain-containing protein [Micromonospora echinospora]|uniref:maleylpyruvate isomerase N-terminal domain-containing protein n=1 Tax=Micromonospora echinospora TaxID=1877 RepID=UPI00342DF299
MRTETEVLGDLWRVWGAWGADLDEAQWTAPTRCAGWDVAALYAHVSQGVGGLAALAQRRSPTGPTSCVPSPRVRPWCGLSCW